MLTPEHNVYPSRYMQKIALPVIFISAVATTLFYVSQEEHGTGTLILLASVLLVGQICATLPFILESQRPRTKAGNGTAADGNAQKIIGNQQIIHEDLRSLGETLIKRLNTLAERQNAIEKNLLTAIPKNKPDMSDELDALREKICHALEEHFEEIAESLNEDDKACDEAAHKKLDAIAERLEDFLVALENLAPGEFDDGPEDSEMLENISAPEKTGNTADNNPEELDAKSVEDFPEEELEFFASEMPETEEDAPATQGEFELGDIPKALGATLILDAMLGIENKPYLRGNAPGLSEDAGIPMTFVEIGRWSHDFNALSGEATVRILRNDNTEDLLGEPVTISPGQTLELAYVAEHA